MRADRLLTILMILQSRGKQTARLLAEELGVSERTIYRDIEALCMSGIPIYTETGPNGGCSLLENYREILTGLKQDEVRVLFLMSVHPIFSQLGMGDSLNKLFLKINADLPSIHRVNVEEINQRIFIDPISWESSFEGGSFLAYLNRAIWEDRWIRMKYRLLVAGEISGEFQPVGLVAKGTRWHLIFCDKQEFMHVVSIRDIVDLEILSEHFKRIKNFQIGKYWKAWEDKMNETHPKYNVHLRVNLSQIRKVPFHLIYLKQLGIPDELNGNFTEVRLQFDNFNEAREKILSWGSAVEVLDPHILRLSIRDYAQQIVNVYAKN